MEPTTDAIFHHLIFCRAAIDQNIPGLFGAAVAHKSQKMCPQMGYLVLKEILHKNWLDKNGNRIFNCDDGTDRIQLNYMPLDERARKRWGKMDQSKLWLFGLAI